ncbi:MAG: carbohydrate kinase family protein [Clostridia bacterium]
MHRNKDSWLCIGGANVDVKAESQGELHPGTSNPGIVRNACGGVARNVAENLARLGRRTGLCALVGADSDGSMLIERTGEIGVDTATVEIIHGKRTGRYLSLHDHSGEMMAAVADMEIMEAWDEHRVQRAIGLMAQADGVFLDANLPEAALRRLVAGAIDAGCFVVIDPVSVAKAQKCKGLLQGVTLFTPNCDEAEVLTGIHGRTKADVEAMADSLFTQGVKHVMITWGPNGVCIRSENETGWLPAAKVTVRDVTGAGDAFTAGVMFGLHESESVFEQAVYGIAMAGAALSSETSVAEAITAEKLKQAKEAYIHEIDDKT